ncbi:MAG: hypothetical protein ACKVLI_05905 [Alphaproteobacteria bacterium]|jgi:hypothetical protein|nr:hypothetical protein [Hyphomicrobiales bacterium]|tara:strand:- start:2680 stop:2979 length:300 start_codon:yes stop_codon:yes gene_type:complete
MRIIQGILSRILFILGVIVYLSTVSIAFVSKGLVVGVLSASLPILSNIYWVQNLWTKTNILFGVDIYYVYIQANFVFIGLAAIAFMLHKIKKYFLNKKS